MGGEPGRGGRVAGAGGEGGGEGVGVWNGLCVDGRFSVAVA